MATLLSHHQDAVKRLAEVPGLGVDSAQQIIAELGARAATFPSEKQLSSWVGACPGDDESAGVNYSHRSPTGIARCGGLLNQAANAAVKAKGSIFEIVYCRTLPRLGHNQAIGAIAHRLGRLIWKILYQRVHHEEPGPAVSKRPKQKRCANDPRTPKRRLSRRTRKSSTGKCRMSAGIFDPVSAFPASCPFSMGPPLRSGCKNLKLGWRSHICNVDRQRPLKSGYNLTRQLRPHCPWSVSARRLAWLRCLAIVKMVAALS